MAYLLMYAAAAALLWAIVSPHVPTGAVGTVGLGIMACGLLLGADDPSRYSDALGMISTGLLVAASMVGYRSLRGRGRMRRLNDWRPDWQHTQPQGDSRQRGGNVKC